MYFALKDLLKKVTFFTVKQNIQLTPEIEQHITFQMISLGKIFYDNTFSAFQLLFLEQFLVAKYLLTIMLYL